MTPAQRLAANKPPRRKPPTSGPTRNAVWTCRLREVREPLRLSLRDVAGAVGMSTPGLWQIEKGSDPMLTTAGKLAAFFGVKIEELWPKLA